MVATSLVTTTAVYGSHRNGSHRLSERQQQYMAACALRQSKPRQLERDQDQEQDIHNTVLRMSRHLPSLTKLINVICHVIIIIASYIMVVQ